MYTRSPKIATVKSIYEPMSASTWLQYTSVNINTVKRSVNSATHWTRTAVKHASASIHVSEFSAAKMKSV